MIDTVTFENEHGEVMRPYEDLGIFLKSHNAALPEPKVYRVSLDGADGDIDMTEWAGEVLYKPRLVNMQFRDMSARHYADVANFVLGRRVKITFSEAPDFYFVGRCERPQTATESRVTDFQFDFTCEPYRLRKTPTRHSIQGSGVLRAARMTAQPTITASAACTMTVGGTAFDLAAGEQTLAGFVVTDRPQRVEISGGATVEFAWRDGVF